MFIEYRTDPVWVSYGFIHFAYILLLLTPLLVRRGSADYIYSRPLYAVTASYFLIELAAGVTLILKAPDNFVLTILLQVILAAIFIGWLISHLIANEYTAKSVARREVELQYVRESSSQVKSILRQVKDNILAKKVERVYDLIHGSPVKSAPEVHSLEEEIINKINLLENAVRQNESEQIGEMVDRIYNLAEERNRKLKLLNRS